MAEVSFDKKINTPFAESGDKTEIPEESNYELVNQKEGFTELYETPIGEGGEYIERQTINQVLYDTQSAVKEIQELGEGDGFPANLTNSNGILPVVNGGTGNSEGKAPSAETADYATNAGSADSATIATGATVANEAIKLQTARSIITDLTSSERVDFDGTANITPGVSGTLPVGNGGTGITSNPRMLIDLESNNSANVFASSPRPGVTGVLPVANGGTGSINIYNNMYNNGLRVNNIDIMTSILNTASNLTCTSEGAFLFPRASAENSGSWYCYCNVFLTINNIAELFNVSDTIYGWSKYITATYSDDILSTVLSKINSNFNKNFTYIEYLGLDNDFNISIPIPIVTTGYGDPVPSIVNVPAFNISDKYFNINIGGVLFYPNLEMSDLDVKLMMKFNVY